MMKLAQGLVLAIAVLAANGTQADDFAIENARVFTLPSDAPIEGGTVIVRGGIVAEVGAGLAVPEGVARIDANGAWLTPGIMNGSSQLGLIELGSDSSTKDSLVTAGPLGADFNIAYAINDNSTAIALARSDGLVRAAIVPETTGTAPFSGSAAIIAPRATGPMLARKDAGVVVAIGGPSLKLAGGSRAAQWTLLRMALMRAEGARATDGPSVGGRPKRGPPKGGPQPAPEGHGHGPHRDADALLQRVLAREAPLVFVTDRESDIRNAVELAQEFGFRPVIIGGAESWRLAADLAAVEAGVVLDPIINLPYTFDRIGTRPDAARLLTEAGVPVAFMASSIHQTYNAAIGIREGAGDSVANGLAWSDALRALTIWPAQIWGLSDTYGRIAPGLSADLVLWDGDPLEPSTQALKVWVEGAEVATVTRQDLLAERYLDNLRARTARPQ